MKNKESTINALESIRNCLKSKQPADDFIRGWVLQNPDVPDAESVAREIYADAIDCAVESLNNQPKGGKAIRSSSLNDNEKQCASRTDELEMAMTTIRGLLHYHKRMCLVSDPSYMADTYEISLVTALECLKKEITRIR